MYLEFKSSIPLFLLHYITDGNGGEAGPKDGVFAFAPQDFVLPHLRLALHDGENFVAPSLPLRALRIPAPPRKTLLFVNLSTIITTFFNKTCFINKNILEITNKFIASNKTNF